MVVYSNTFHLVYMNITPINLPGNYVICIYSLDKDHLHMSVMLSQFMTWFTSSKDNCNEV